MSLNVTASSSTMEASTMHSGPFNVARLRAAFDQAFRSPIVQASLRDLAQPLRTYFFYYHAGYKDGELRISLQALITLLVKAEIIPDEHSQAFRDAVQTFVIDRTTRPPQASSEQDTSLTFEHFLDSFAFIAYTLSISDTGRSLVSVSSNSEMHWDLALPKALCDLKDTIIERIFKPDSRSSSPESFKSPNFVPQTPDTPYLTPAGVFAVNPTVGYRETAQKTGRTVWHTPRQDLSPVPFDFHTSTPAHSEASTLSSVDPNNLPQQSPTPSDKFSLTPAPTFGIVTDCTALSDRHPNLVLEDPCDSNSEKTPEATVNSDPSQVSVRKNADPFSPSPTDTNKSEDGSSLSTPYVTGSPIDVGSDSGRDLMTPGDSSPMKSIDTSISVPYFDQNLRRAVSNETFEDHSPSRETEHGKDLITTQDEIVTRLDNSCGEPAVTVCTKPALTVSQCAEADNTKDSESVEIVKHVTFDGNMESPKPEHNVNLPIVNPNHMPTSTRGNRLSTKEEAPLLDSPSVFQTEGASTRDSKANNENLEESVIYQIGTGDSARSGGPCEALSSCEAQPCDEQRASDAGFILDGEPVYKNKNPKEKSQEFQMAASGSQNTGVSNTEFGPCVETPIAQADVIEATFSKVESTAPCDHGTEAAFECVPSTDLHEVQLSSKQGTPNHARGCFKPTEKNDEDAAFAALEAYNEHSAGFLTEEPTWEDVEDLFPKEGIFSIANMDRPCKLSCAVSPGPDTYQSLDGSCHKDKGSDVTSIHVLEPTPEANRQHVPLSMVGCNDGKPSNLSEGRGPTDACPNDTSHDGVETDRGSAKEQLEQKELGSDVGCSTPKRTSTNDGPCPNTPHGSDTLTSTGRTDDATFGDNTPANLASPFGILSPELSEPREAHFNISKIGSGGRTLRFDDLDDDDSDCSSNYSESVAVEPLRLTDKGWDEFGNEVDDTELSESERLEKDGMDLIDAAGNRSPDDQTYDTSFLENSQEILADGTLGIGERARRGSAEEREEKNYFEFEENLESVTTIKMPASLYDSMDPVLASALKVIRESECDDSSGIEDDSGDSEENCIVLSNVRLHTGIETGEERDEINGLEYLCRRDANTDGEAVEASLRVNGNERVTHRVGSDGEMKVCQGKDWMGEWSMTPNAIKSVDLDIARSETEKENVSHSMNDSATLAHTSGVDEDGGSGDFDDTGEFFKGGVLEEDDLSTSSSDLSPEAFQFVRKQRNSLVVDEINYTEGPTSPDADSDSIMQLERGGAPDGNAVSEQQRETSEEDKSELTAVEILDEFGIIQNHLNTARRDEGSDSIMEVCRRVLPPSSDAGEEKGDAEILRDETESTTAAKQLSTSQEICTMTGSTVARKDDVKIDKLVKEITELVRREEAVCQQVKAEVVRRRERASLLPKSCRGIWSKVVVVCAKVLVWTLGVLAMIVGAIYVVGQFRLARIDGSKFSPAMV